MENDNSSLIIYDGGSKQAEMIANLNNANSTKISTPRNQIFAVIYTNGQTSEIKLNARIVERK